MNIKRLIKVIFQMLNNIYNFIILKYRYVNYGNNLKITGRIFAFPTDVIALLLEIIFILIQVVEQILLEATQRLYYMRRETE